MWINISPNLNLNLSPNLCLNLNPNLNLNLSPDLCPNVRSKKSQKLMSNPPPMREDSIKKNHPPIRRLLFSKTFYYGIFEDFSFRMFWNIPRLLFFFSERSYRQNNTTFPNNHEKQAERCIKIHTLVYRCIRFHNMRARITLAGD